MTTKISFARTSILGAVLMLTGLTAALILGVNLSPAIFLCLAPAPALQFREIDNRKARIRGLVILLVVGTLTAVWAAAIQLRYSTGFEWLWPLLLLESGFVLFVIPLMTNAQR